MRILLYSHDSYGLGHIRRSLEIARQLSSDLPHASQLLVTGSMQAHVYQLPERMDYVKLPTIGKQPDGKYLSRILPLPLKKVLVLRERLILDVLRDYHPDIVLVDKAAAGLRGEILSSLHFLKKSRPETRIVLGMRDIEDTPECVRAEWARDGIYGVLEDLYDAIVLYGTRSLYDPVSEYQLSPGIEQKLTACGYIGRGGPVIPKKRVRRDLNMRTDKLVVVTGGGGGDAFELLTTYLESLKRRKKRHKYSPKFDSLVITGPLMDAAQRDFLYSSTFGYRGLAVMEFTPDLFSYLNAANLIVSMGGYNSVTEILSLNQRAVIVPRVAPRQEQLIRAERLAAKGLVHMVHPHDLSANTLYRTVREALDADRPVRPQAVGIDTNGAANVRRAIVSLSATSAGTRQNSVCADTIPLR